MATINKNSLRVITRVVEAGYATEKDIAAIGLAEAVSIPNITVTEMKGISELQAAIREKRLFSFFIEGVKEETQNEA